MEKFIKHPPQNIYYFFLLGTVVTVNNTQSTKPEIEEFLVITNSKEKDFIPIYTKFEYDLKQKYK